MDGIIGVYKEKGYTSHDVVAKLRGILHQKKIGHTGTLDPDAEGVLPICLGKGTKLCDLLTDKDKTYVAVCRLGVVTDTQDLTGTVLQQNQVYVTEKEVKECITSFLGEYWQIPPMYSALKVGGKKLCDLAREGIYVERKARKVVFYDIELLEYQKETHCFTMQVHCSKGTYIRTLCHDIGEKLGCGAAMGELVRTRVADFTLDTVYRLREIEELCARGQIESVVRPVESMFPACPKAHVCSAKDKALYNGNIIKEEDVARVEQAADAKEERYLFYDSFGRFVALYRKDGKLYRLEKMFFPDLKV